ncbi:hypothetical protein EUTSA_v10017260mg [Eutrema salsugineum]|uniref:Uncharacterized protein n=1 Tax=Eutrema salsugineum TaxID=72664 RepID=V4MGA0_EUTSA|nr:uncharacterized protein LOC18026665 [Eutrema salsugineum]XP_024003791.1 uncharacterized protein LOC18026665 [Eutrema salsugineum]ESQ51558.1 hypothetical protein EUTSA_v10017260mg [Eutrema salsugineum]
MRAACVLLAFCFFVFGGGASKLASPKNPEEVVRFPLNRKPRILLQLAPHVSHKIKLTVTGGCANASGDYKWLSSDVTVVAVSSYGVIQAKSPGISTVKAVSTCDPLNFDEIVVKVFASQDLCYDMDGMEPMVDNDQPEPSYFSMPKFQTRQCFNLIMLLESLATFTIIIYNRCLKKRKKQHSKKRYRRPLRRRLGARWP